MDTTKMEAVIRDSMSEVAIATGSKLLEDMTGDSVLLESGLDSLGFAMLVALLEEKLGYDPFVISEEAYYPATLADFVGFYQKYSA